MVATEQMQSPLPLLLLHLRSPPGPSFSRSQLLSGGKRFGWGIEEGCITGQNCCRRGLCRRGRPDCCRGLCCLPREQGRTAGRGCCRRLRGRDGRLSTTGNGGDGAGAITVASPPPPPLLATAAAAAAAQQQAAEAGLPAAALLPVQGGCQGCQLRRSRTWRRVFRSVKAAFPQSTALADEPMTSPIRSARLCCTCSGGKMRPS